MSRNLELYTARGGLDIKACDPRDSIIDIGIESMYGHTDLDEKGAKDLVNYLMAVLGEDGPFLVPPKRNEVYAGRSTCQEVVVDFLSAQGVHYHDLDNPKFSHTNTIEVFDNGYERVTP